MLCGWGGGGGGERLIDFKFGTFIGHFQSDGAVSMAVEGLIIMPLIVEGSSYN